MSETDELSFSIVINDVYNERRSSIIRTFNSIFEELLSNRNNITDSISIQQVESFVNKIIKKHASSEQEQFLSYLIYLISHIAKISNLKDPNFASEFYIKKKLFDQKYDSNGQLLKVLQTFRANPIQPNFPPYTSFFALFLGFSFDATTIRSTLFDLRNIVKNNLKSVYKILKIERQKVIAFTNKISMANKSKSDHLRKKIKSLQLIREKESNSYQTSLNDLTTQLEFTKRSLSEMHKFRLKVEGDLIQIIRNIDSLSNENLLNTTAQVTVGELKKQSVKLLSDIKLTTESTSSLNMSSNSFDDSKTQYNYVQQLNEKDVLIKNLKNQLQNTVNVLNTDVLAQSEPTHTVAVDSTVKMNKMLIKTSLDFRKALTEKQEMTQEMNEMQRKLDSFYSIQTEYNLMKKERNTFKEQLNETTIINEKLIKKNQNLQEQLHSQTMQVESLMTHISKLKGRIDQQKNIIRISERPPTDEDIKNIKGSLLIEEITEKTNSLIECELANTQLFKDNMKLANEIEILNESRGLDQNKIRAFQENINSLKHQLEQRDELCRDLRTQLSESEVFKLQKQIQNLSNEKENITNKFNRLAKHYQKLKDNTTELLADRERLQNQVEVDKTLIKEANKKKKQKQDEVTKLLEKIEKIKEKTINSNDLLLLSQKYPGVIPNASKFNENAFDLIEYLADKENQVEKSNKTLLNQKEIEEAKSNQLQELVDKLQKENHQLSTYYKDILSKFSAFFPNCKEEKDLPEIAHKIIEDKEELSSYINELKKLTEVEDTSNIPTKIIELLSNDKDLQKIKNELKCESNEEVIKKINDLNDIESGFNKLKESNNFISVEDVEEKMCKLNEISDILKVSDIKVIPQMIENMINESKQISSILGINCEKEDDNIKNDSIINTIGELKTKLENDQKLKDDLNQILPFNDSADLLQKVTGKLQENEELLNAAEHNNKLIQEIKDIFPDVEPEKISDRITEIKSKWNSLINSISEKLNIKQTNNPSEKSNEKQIFDRISELKSIEDILQGSFPQEPDIEKITHDLLNNLANCERVFNEIKNYISFDKIEDLPQLIASIITQNNLEEEEEEDIVFLDHESNEKITFNLELIKDDESKNEKRIINNTKSNKSENRNKERRSNNNAKNDMNYSHNKKNSFKNEEEEEEEDDDDEEEDDDDDDENIKLIHNEITRRLSVSSIKDVPESILNLTGQMSDTKRALDLLQSKYDRFISSLKDVLRNNKENFKSENDIISRVSELSYSEDILNSIQNMLNLNDSRSIPNAIRALQDENTTKGSDLKQFQSIFSQLKEVVGTSLQKNDLIDTIRQMKNENANLSNLIEQLQTAANFDRDGQVASFIREIVEKNPKDSIDMEKLLAKAFPSNKLDTILDEVQKLKENFAAEVSELKGKHQKFIDSITKILANSLTTDDESEIPTAILRLSKERAELQKKDIDHNILLENLRNQINFHNDGDLITKVGNLVKLKKRIQKVKDEIIGIKDIDEIPHFVGELQSELLNAHKKQASIAKQLSELSGENEEGKQISSLSKQLNQSRLFENDIKRMLNSQDEKDALSKLRDILNDKKSFDLLRDSVSVDVGNIPTEMLKIQNQLNSFKSDKSILQNDIDSKDAEISKLKTAQTNFLASLSAVLETEFFKEDKAIKCISELKAKYEEIKKNYSSFQTQIKGLLEVNDFSEIHERISDILDDNNEMRNELKDMNEMINNLKKDLSCDDLSQLAETYNNLKNTKDQSKEQHNRFVRQIAQALQQANPSVNSGSGSSVSSPRYYSGLNELQLADMVAKLKISNNELIEKAKQTEKIVEDLKKLIQFEDFEDFPNTIQSILEENDNALLIADTLNCDVYDLPNAINSLNAEIEAQKSTLEKVASNLGIPNVKDHDSTSDDSFLSKIVNNSQLYKKQQDLIKNLMKSTKSDDVNDLNTKVEEAIKGREEAQEKASEAEKELLKFQTFVTDLQNQFGNVSKNANDLSKIPQEIALLKDENEKLKSNNNELSNSYKKFKEQIANGLKIWVSQSPEELAKNVNELKETNEIVKNQHDNLIDKLGLTLKFENEDQIPSIVEKIVSENQAMSDKLQRFAQIQSSLEDTAIDDTPRTLTQLRSSLKSKSDQFDELFNRHRSLINGIRQISPFTNENEIITNIQQISEAAKSYKEKYDNLIASTKKIVDFNDDTDVPNIFGTMKKMLAEKEEAEKNTKNIIKNIQKITNSKDISELSKDVQKLQKQNEKSSKAINSIKSLLSLEDDEAIPMTVQNLVDAFQEAKNEVEKDQEIFGKLKNIIAFDSPEELVNEVEKMKSKMQSSTKSINSILSTLKPNNIEDVPQMIKQMKNDLNKINNNYSNLNKKLSSVLDTSLENDEKGNKNTDSFVEKVEELKNELQSKSDLLNAIQEKHADFVDSISRIVKETEEDEIPKQVAQLADRLKTLDIDCQSHVKTLSSLKRILSVNNDETLVRTVQKLFNSTRQIKSTVAHIHENNLPLSKDVSISELNTHIMSFQAEFDAIRGKFDQVKRMFQVTDDDQLFNVLFALNENHKQLVSQLLNLTKLSKEDEIVGFIKKLILSHNDLIRDLRDIEGVEDIKDIKDAVENDKRCLRKVRNMLGSQIKDNSDLFNAIEKMKQTVDDIKEITGTENSDQISENVKKVFDTLNPIRSNQGNDSNSYSENASKMVNTAEKRKNVLDELKTATKVEDLDEMKEKLIKGKEIIDRLKELAGTNDESQILPQIQALIEASQTESSKTPTSKSGFNNSINSSKPTLNQIKDSIKSNKELADTLRNVTKLEDIEQIKEKIKQTQQFVDDLKEATGTNDENEILQHIKELVANDHENDDSSYNNNSGSGSSSPRKLISPSGSLKNALKTFRSNRKLSDSLKNSTQLENSDEIADKLIQSQQIVDNLKQMTGIDNDEKLVSQIAEIFNAASKDDDSNNKTDKNNSPTTEPRKRPLLTLPQMRNSIEQNRKLSNALREVTNVDDDEEVAEILLNNKKVVDNLKEITGIDDIEQIAPQIKSILGSIKNGDNENGDDKIKDDESDYSSKKNKPSDLNQLKKAIDDNKRLAESLKKQTNSNSSDEADDKLRHWKELIDELREITGVEKDSQILPQIKDIFSAFQEGEKIEGSANKISKDQSKSKEKGGSSLADRLKQSVQNNNKLMNLLRKASLIDSDEENDLSQLVDKMATNKKLADQMKEITEIDDEDLIAKNIRNIFNAAKESNISLSNNSRNINSKLNNKDDNNISNNDVNNYSRQIVENQRLLNELQRISNVEDIYMLKDLVLFVNDLKKIAGEDDLNEIKINYEKRAKVLEQLSYITEAKSENEIADEVRKVFSLFKGERNKKQTLAEQLIASYETNQITVIEFLRLFKADDSSQLQDIAKRYITLITELVQIFQLQSDAQIKSSVLKMKQTISDLRNVASVDKDEQIKLVFVRYRNLLESISTIVSIDLINSKNSNESNNNARNDSILVQTLKKLVLTENRYNTLIDVLKKYFEIDRNKEDNIPKITDEMLSQAKIDRNFITHLLSLIKESDQVEINFDESLSANIVEWFIKYLKEADVIMADHKKYMDSANVYGYQGSSALEASDYLIECAITRRKHEIMESAHDEIESLRKNSDAKVSVIEQRNKELRESLQEARKARQDAQQSCTEMQKECIEKEIALQNEISELHNSITKSKRIQDEIVRLAGGKVYDKEFLTSVLPHEDQIMLKIL